MKQSQVQEGAASRFHLWLGIVIAGVLLAILLEAIAQVLPPYYSPISQTESDLAVGPYGFLEAINFFIRGVYTLIFLVALMNIIPKEYQSRSGLTLLGLSAIGKLIIAFVATDLTARPETVHGTVHALVAVLSFICGALGLLLIALSLRHDPNVHPSPLFLAGFAIVTFVWSLIVIATIVVSSQIGIWGLMERILSLLFNGWILIVSIGLWRYPSYSTARQSEGQADMQRQT
jgi:hypothetical protein